MELTASLKLILKRGYVLKSRKNSKFLKDERFLSFDYQDSFFTKTEWRHKLKTFLNTFKSNSYLDPYAKEDETNKCFEIAYCTNMCLLETYLNEINAKLVVFNKMYVQTFGGFKKRVSKMAYPIGILFDTGMDKMLFLIKNPKLFYEK